MKDLILYIHGKDGRAGESGHYSPLFPGCEVLGLNYQAFTPREAGAEIYAAVSKLKDQYRSIALIANSIGAYFSMNAGIEGMIRRAWFISPIVDMENLICDRMAQAGVTEAELCSRGVIPTSFGEALSWEYLRYVRAHPLRWEVPTEILYGENDELTIRVSTGREGVDLSGDYNEYSHEWDENFKGLLAHCSGDGEMINAALFDGPGAHFAVLYNTGEEGRGLTADQLKSLVMCMQAMPLS